MNRVKKPNQNKTPQPKPTKPKTKNQNTLKYRLKKRGQQNELKGRNDSSYEPPNNIFQIDIIGPQFFSQSKNIHCPMRQI